MTTQYVQAKIRRFVKRFNDLKKAARGCLEKRKISVEQVVDALTSMSPDDNDEHRQFLKQNLSDLYQSTDIPELIGKLSVLHWDYLSYQLLDYLIKEFGLELRREMEAYKLDLQRFRLKIPLALFCQSKKRRRMKPSEEFKEMVAEFDWPHEVTLEVVEQFRQEYAYYYKLRDCAMLLAKVLPGSFIITWFIPESIVEKLREGIPHHILKKYTVVNLEIAGVKVYPPPQVRFVCCIITACYLRPPCLYGRSPQQSRHLVLDLQLVVPLLLLRNHLLSMLLYPLLHGELHYYHTIHPDPRQRSPVSHQMKITPSLRSQQRISSVQ